MKNLDLNKYGVQEMNAEEIICLDGGFLKTIPNVMGTRRALIDGFDAVCGFCNGFFGF